MPEYSNENKYLPVPALHVSKQIPANLNIDLSGQYALSGLNNEDRIHQKALGLIRKRFSIR